MTMAPCLTRSLASSPHASGHRARLSWRRRRTRGLLPQPLGVTGHEELLWRIQPFLRIERSQQFFRRIRAPDVGLFRHAGHVTAIGGALPQGHRYRLRTFTRPCCRESRQIGLGDVVRERSCRGTRTSCRLPAPASCATRRCRARALHVVPGERLRQTGEQHAAADRVDVLPAIALLMGTHRSKPGFGSSSQRMSPFVRRSSGVRQRPRAIRDPLASCSTPGCC